MLYRTLVIAPRTDLVLVEDEMTAVVNALNAQLLHPMVTASSAMDRISEGWDIIWFMTHGTEEGIVLSDGPLSASSLTTFIRSSGAKLVVLNSCESIGVALDIHNELLTNLVCTLTKVPDREAFFMGKQLALHLARGKTFSQAYLDAKPGQNQSYIFLVGKEMNPTVPPIPPLPGGAPLDADRLRRLDELLRGDEWGQQGLVATVRAILAEINSLKRAVLILQIGGVTLLLITFIILLTVVSIYLAGT